SEKDSVSQGRIAVGRRGLLRGGHGADRRSSPGSATGRLAGERGAPGQDAAESAAIRSRHDAPRMRINSYPEDVVRKVGMGMLAGFPAIVHETPRLVNETMAMS